MADLLRLENVSKTYTRGLMHAHITTALRDFTLTLKEDEPTILTVAGESGSGKTTLVKLLVGLYKPGEGSVLYNGLNASDIDIEELRMQIGFVTQDTQLFSGTIRENLLFVNPRATDEELMRALERAACYNLLARAENGIDTVIGEGGIKNIRRGKTAPLHRAGAAAAPEAAGVR